MKLWNSYAALERLCGFAASRAENLWLSVEPSTFFAATPPEAKPLLILICERRARGFPHGGRQSRKSIVDLGDLISGRGGLCGSFTSGFLCDLYTNTCADSRSTGFDHLACVFESFNATRGFDT